MSIADLQPALDAVYKTIREWFPHAKKEDCDELAFAIVHDTLHMGRLYPDDPYWGRLWTAAIDQPPTPHQQQESGAP
jgi:hypothetical protein